MFRLERMVSILFMFLALVLVAPNAMAESATSFVKKCQEDVTGFLQDMKPGAARDKKVADVLDRMIDYDDLTRTSLAAHWNELKDPQRAEFKDTLTKLVRKSYERNIKDILDFTVEYVSEEVLDGGPIVLVRTRAVPKNNKGDEPITIDYRMDRPGGKWRVVDIITEDSSLVGNYRSQFHRTIQKDGYDALVRKMKNKLAKGDASFKDEPKAK